MKAARYISLTVLVVSFIALLFSSINLSNNYHYLLGTSQTTCNTTAGYGGKCLPPKMQPDFIIIISSAVLLGVSAGWLGHYYLNRKKAD